MFRSFDKITLSLVNAKDVFGNILLFNLVLPIDDSEYFIPYNLASVDVFEYQEGTINVGYTAFKLLVGKKASIKDLVAEYGVKQIRVKSGLDILSAESDVCYQEIDGEKFIFENVSEQDIVLSTPSELSDVVVNLSNDYSSFQQKLGKIKQLSDYVLK